MLLFEYRVLREEVMSSHGWYGRQLASSIESLVMEVNLDGPPPVLAEYHYRARDDVPPEQATRTALPLSSQLQMALTDPSLAAEHKTALVRDLIGASAAPTTTALVSYAAANLRGRQPAVAIESLATLAADQRQRLLAEVRSAVELTSEQVGRLAAALSTLQGRDVRLNVIVDREVVGGIVVRVGEDVIDGSVASRFEQARRAVTA